MDLLVIETIIEKVEAAETRLNTQGKELTEITKKISTMTDQTNTIKTVVDLVKKLQGNINNITWPVREITEMSSRLSRNNELLANPKKTKQVVFHTAGKLIWVIVILSALIISLIVFLVNTSNKLEQTKMNDMLWRYIRLSNNSQNLEYLQSVERMYLAHPEKMKYLVEKEELRIKQIGESEIKNHDQSAPDTTSVLDKKRKIKLKADNNN
jgi:hypothetical protein